MSAPMMTARAALKVMPCFLTKEISSRAVAVELCRRAVVAMPETIAMKRFDVPCAIARRSEVPYARVKPSLTIRVPHKRRQTAAAIWRSVSEIGAMAMPFRV